ncbi:MAG: tRNA (adenosine(37)-N6)-threonylcarbamoyltransferase complex transferase subunit TsaD [Bacteroidia bacterium]|nr:tRNA (adenosine(37)-N6)-threonylcarbamoyltransferase complex transferase subunit TsaD [Bacteroidia bacterium]
MKPVILAIESSCDETSAAVLENGKVLSNIVSSQLAHAKYGGVVPEIASRLHQQDIIAVVHEALEKSGKTRTDLDAIAFTRGPGLLGSLLVGTCFAKSYAFGLGIPLIEVNHMQAHVLANFLSDSPPAFPFLCLTVSGGHTQIVLVRNYLDMEVIGQTLDDAAGEAYDKAGKIMGLPYPAGPVIDKLAKEGNIDFHDFPIPSIPGLNFSFSGLKTNLLYFLRDNLALNPDFIQQNINDICASYQHRIVSYLLAKLKKAAREYKVKDLAIAGGVSANSELRRQFGETCEKLQVRPHIPAFQFCTDNAGMIGIAAHFKYLAGEFADLEAVPFTREG